MLAPGHPPPEESSADVRWVIEAMQREHGFLAPGFRGASFCIAPAQVSRATLSLLVHLGTNRLLTEVFDLGVLSQWLQ
jgi:hypothetical protein